MFGVPSGVKIYLSAEPTDMRKGVDGLSRIVEASIKTDVYSGALFVFVSRRVSDLLKTQKSGPAVTDQKRLSEKVPSPTFLATIKKRTELGAGGQATTYLAHHRDSPDSPVLLKAFGVAEVEDWKATELFERSAAVLESLDHPLIPRYRDHFEVTNDRHTQLVLVRDMVDGETLQARIDRRATLDADDLVAVALELLDVLDYISGREPPVVHRDIKPDNIVLGTDGSPYLVDFGAVQAELQAETGASTVVGTIGYVAPEQLMGRARPASDVYSLGATLAHLATGIAPSDLPNDELQIDVTEVLADDPPLASILQAMLEADVDHRLTDIRMLRRAFERYQAGEAPLEPPTALPVLAHRNTVLETIDYGPKFTARSPLGVVWRTHSSALSPAMIAARKSKIELLLSVLTLIVLGLGLFSNNPDFQVFMFMFVAPVCGAVAVVSSLFTGRFSIELRHPDFQVKLPPLMRVRARLDGASGREESVGRGLVISYDDVRDIRLERDEHGQLNLVLDLDAARTLSGKERPGGTFIVNPGLNDEDSAWLLELLQTRMKQLERG
jgi:serine/threonine protein kinase